MKKLTVLKNDTLYRPFFFVKILISFLLLLSIVSVSAQERLAAKYYDKGVAAFKKNDFKTADSLFKLSIKAKPDIDAYYNLALVKLQLPDSSGCCFNLQKAAELGDIEARTNYEIMCSAKAKQRLKYYNDGISLYNDENYKAADSVLRLSSKIYPTANVYYKIAVTRFKLLDTCSYCAYLDSAKQKKHDLSGALYDKTCIKKDTFHVIDSLHLDYTIINIITSSKCSKDREYDYFKIKGNDTIFKFSTPMVEKGFIISAKKTDSSKIHTGYTIRHDTISQPIRKDNKNYVFVNEKHITVTEIPSIIEIMPSFEGGEEAMYMWLAKNMIYPMDAKENGIMGTVIITFVVEKDGTISDPKILKDIGGGCGAEALRVVETMPKWKPAKLKGVPIKVFFTLPIRFTLN